MHTNNQEFQKNLSTLKENPVKLSQTVDRNISKTKYYEGILAAYELKIKGLRGLIAALEGIEKESVTSVNLYELGKYKLELADDLQAQHSADNMLKTFKQRIEGFEFYLEEIGKQMAQHWDTLMIDAEKYKNSDMKLLLILDKYEKEVDKNDQIEKMKFYLAVRNYVNLNRKKNRLPEGYN